MTTTARPLKNNNTVDTIETIDTPSTPRGGARSSPAVTLIVLLSATFMTILDAFIVNVAIPAIEIDLNPSQSQIQLVVAAYSLTYAAGLVASGRLGDRFGHRNMFSLGMAIFVLASLGCGIAPTINTLLLTRAIQGAAAALMVPQVLTLLGLMFTGTDRAWAFRWFGITLGLASGTGQIIGGALIDLDTFGLGWRNCFLINIPIGLAALVAARRTLPAKQSNKSERLDVVGAVLISSAMAAFVLPLIEGRQRGWPAWTFASFVAAAALFVLFGAHVRRLTRLGGSPLVALPVLTNRRLMTGIATVTLFYGGVASFFLVLSIYLQQGRGLDAFPSGAVFSIMVAGFLLTTFWGHRLTILGSHSLTVGAIVIAVGHLGMRFAVLNIGVDGPLPWLFLPMLLSGAGTGLVMAPLVSTMLARVEPGLAGTASGLYSSGQQLGNTIGVAVIGIVYFGTTGPSPSPAAITKGMAASHLYLFVVSLVVAALLHHLRPRSSNPLLSTKISRRRPQLPNERGTTSGQSNDNHRTRRWQTNQTTRQMRLDMTATTNPVTTDLSIEMLNDFRRLAATDDAANSFFDETHRQLLAAGHYTANLPTEHGGGGQSLFEMGRRQRLLARYAPAPALASCMHLYWTGAAADLYHQGHHGLDAVIDGAVAGEIFASGHAEAGNDVPVVLSTTNAQPVPGGYRITGRKHFGSLGPVWTQIGFHAMDTSDPAGPEVIHGFIRRSDPGVNVVENWDTITMRASQSHDVALESVFVPNERIIAKLPAGSSDDPVTATAFFWALALVSNVYIGVAERALEIAVESLTSKTSIALDGRTLAHNPMLQQQVAEMWIALDGAAASLDMLATDWINGVDHGPVWGMKIGAAKHRTSQIVRSVLDTAMEAAGGGAIRSDNELSRLLRDSRGVAYHPPSAALAYESIGKAVLGIDPAGPRW